MMLILGNVFDKNSRSIVVGNVQQNINNRADGASNYADRRTLPQTVEIMCKPCLAFPLEEIFFLDCLITSLLIKH